MESHCRELDLLGELDFRRRSLRALVRRHLLPGKTLDLGCGYGHLSMELARRGYPVTAVDVSPAMIESLRARAQGLPLRAEIMAAEEIDRLGEGSFVNVVSLDVLEHIADDARLLERIFARLLKGGRLIVIVPALPRLFGRRDIRLGHYRRYSRAGLRRKIAAAGFGIEILRYWNATALLPYFVSEKVLRREISDLPRLHAGKAWRLAGVALAGMLRLENRLPLPLGISLFAVARKP